MTSRTPKPPTEKPTSPQRVVYIGYRLTQAEAALLAQHQRKFESLSRAARNILLETLGVTDG